MQDPNPVPVPSTRMSRRTAIRLLGLACLLTVFAVGVYLIDDGARFTSRDVGPGTESLPSAATQYLGRGAEQTVYSTMFTIRSNNERDFVETNHPGPAYDQLEGHAGSDTIDIQHIRITPGGTVSSYRYGGRTYHVTDNGARDIRDGVILVVVGLVIVGIVVAIAVPRRRHPKPVIQDELPD